VHEDGVESPGDSSADSAAESVIAPGSPEPARAIEMAYWSEEPGLLEIIRAVACCRPETRIALLAFLSRASDARRISAAAGQGTLVLSLV
jgi:hypothetical protein